MTKNELKVAVFEHDIVWADKESNILKVKEVVSELTDVDVLVLPEMFATGFIFDENLAEEDNGLIINCIKSVAAKSGIAICGTFLARENGNLYNRCFFITPEGDYHKYDKKHLFCLSKEKDLLTAGDEKTVFDFKGWNIALFVCYDLRFPVWMRNSNNMYDVIILPANWPDLREFAWKHLLIARAIENQSYVIAANRTGYDDFKLKYSGNGMVLDYTGAMQSEFRGNVKIATLNHEKLMAFRNKYQFWKDAD